MKTIYIPTLILFCLFNIQCNKRVDKINPNFIGKWISGRFPPYATLLIENNSDAEYTEFAESMHSITRKGKARIINSKLYIGRFLSFKIIRQPTLIDTHVTKSYAYGEILLGTMALKTSSLYTGSGAYVKIIK
ncbi:MAG TPA: hypothetical protein PLU10_06300 [Chitinophagaceae bacterium]|nr:hypothetical protein [Chitinophagaceae bacterium]